jgi:hypothetical protein
MTKKQAQGELQIALAELGGSPKKADVQAQIEIFEPVADEFDLDLEGLYLLRDLAAMRSETFSSVIQGLADRDPEALAEALEQVR